MKRVLNIMNTKENIAIQKFRLRSNDLILYKEMETIPFNTIIQINNKKEGNIECTRIMSNGEDNLSFRITMKQGEVWQPHYHDCFETILLYKGKLKDLYSNKEITRAETFSFKPYTSHYVRAEEDSIFYVEFKNPKNI